MPGTGMVSAVSLASLQTAITVFAVPKSIPTLAIFPFFFVRMRLPYMVINNRQP